MTVSINSISDTLPQFASNLQYTLRSEPQITLRVEVDPVTLAPSDRLDEGLLEWASELGVKGIKTVGDFLESHQNKVRFAEIFTSETCFRLDLQEQLVLEYIQA